MPVAAKDTWLFWWYPSNKNNFQKISEGEISFRTLPSNAVQIFRKFMLNSQVIFYKYNSSRRQIYGTYPGMNGLTHMLLVANFANRKWCNDFEKYLKPWHMLLIWEFSARTFQSIPTWQGLDALGAVLWTKVALEGLKWLCIEAGCQHMRSCSKLECCEHILAGFQAWLVVVQRWPGGWMTDWMLGWVVCWVGGWLCIDCCCDYYCCYRSSAADTL